MFNNLDGDGMIENIYHYLWSKDNVFQKDTYIAIPQTILYKYQKPCYWYFTSVVDHKLKKKSTAKVNVDHIREVFTKKKSRSGIIAYYIYKKAKIMSKYESDKPNFEKTMNSLFDKDPDACLNAKSGYIIEYFDMKKFDEFLTNKISYEDGILQKFEDPKGDYNCTFRLQWAPGLCIYEKCTNLKKITDKRYDIYERAVTYDGEEFQIKIEQLKGVDFCNRICKIAEKIAEHISNISMEKMKIIRMLLNFTITKDDRIVFLWCSSLRIENGLDKRHYNHEKVKECDISKITMRTPEDINLFKYSINGKPIKPHKDATCLNCDLKVESYRLYEISFRSLIESHENRKRDKSLFEIYNKINMTSSGVEVIPYMDNKNNDIVEKLRKKNYKNFIIPKVIAEIYPKMKYEDYFNLKKDSIFNSKTACVCESCFLDITKYCAMTGTNLDNVLRTMKPGVTSSSFPIVQSSGGISTKITRPTSNAKPLKSAKNRAMMNSRVDYNFYNDNIKGNTEMNKTSTKYYKSSTGLSLPPANDNNLSRQGGMNKKSNTRLNHDLFDTDNEE